MVERDGRPGHRAPAYVPSDLGSAGLVLHSSLRGRAKNVEKMSERMVGYAKGFPWAHHVLATQVSAYGFRLIHVNRVEMSLHPSFMFFSGPDILKSST